MNLRFSDLSPEQQDMALEINRIVATKINKHCNACKISVSRFMADNDVCRPAYNNILSAQKLNAVPVSVQLFTFVRIASAMNITVDELLKK